MFRIFHAIACHAAKPLLYCNKRWAPGAHVLTDLGPLAINGDPNGLINTQVAGDDNLTFIYAYHPDSGAGSTKHLYAYLPQTNVASHLLDSTLLDMGEPPLAFAGRLYFKGSDPVNADQPWVSDGTVAGTHILLMGAANIPPLAGNDSASSANDASVTINVLANDIDSDGWNTWLFGAPLYRIQ